MYKLMCCYVNEDREDEVVCYVDTEYEAEKAWIHYAEHANSEIAYYIVEEE